MEIQYVVVERAHLMCPNMHFGIICSIDKVYDSSKVKETIKYLQEAHPFFRCLIANDERGRIYYDLHDELEIKCEVKNSLRSFKEDYYELSKNGWNVYSESLLKILLYPESDKFKILFVAHHLLCDGRGLLGLAVEFADYYVKGIKPSYAPEVLLKTIDDLPKGSDLPWISKIIINSVNRNWQKENRQVDYKEYLKFEKSYTENVNFNLQIEAKSKEELRNMLAECHYNKISLNDYLIAKMMKEEATNKVIIAADVRKYLKFYNKGSLGNYATAFSVVVNSKTEDFMELAKRVSVQVKKHLNNPQKLMLVVACYLRMKPELIDAVAISTLGNFNSKAGRFVGSKLFGYKDRNGYSITNLGKIESDTLVEATFIPPASPANKKTVGVVTINGKLQCCSVTIKK